MKLQLPAKIVHLLKDELRQAGRREIGGVIVGEHIESETFRIADISIQRDGGNSVRFIRDPVQANEFLADYFLKTGSDFQRANYMGEWHSHPSFPAKPSSEDYDTAQEIAESSDVGANFIVLMICRRRFWRGLELSVTLFRPNAKPEPVEIELEVIRKFI